MKLSDEALQAPMGVFFPAVFCLPDDDTPLMWGQKPLQPDGADVFDEGHWMADGGMAPQIKGAGPLAKVEGQGTPATNEGVAGGDGGEQGECPEVTKRLQTVPPGKMLGLDKAIHFSIDTASK